MAVPNPKMDYDDLRVYRVFVVEEGVEGREMHHAFFTCKAEAVAFKNLMESEGKSAMLNAYRWQAYVEE